MSKEVVFEAVIDSSSALGLPFFASRLREDACFAADLGGGGVVPETEPDLEPVLEPKPNRALNPLLLESVVLVSAMADTVQSDLFAVAAVT